MASCLFDEKTAVLAFWTATSQENMVASPTRKVPSTAGGSRAWSGLLTTAMKTFAEVPSGRRMPARVMAALCAALVMIDWTSAAVSRPAFPITFLPGTLDKGSSMNRIAPPGSEVASEITGPRNSPPTPPSSTAGYGYGGGGSWMGKPSTIRPARLSNGSTFETLAMLSTGW